MQKATDAFGLAQKAKESNVKSSTHTVDGEYIREWLVLGPFFPNNLSTDFLADVGGEANIKPKEGDTPVTVYGRKLNWKRYQARGGIIDLADAIGDYELTTVYAFCVLYSEVACEAQILISSDDGAAVWINGEQVHNNPDADLGDEDVFEVSLRAGNNHCLIKICHGLGFWTFAMRVSMLPPKRAVISEGV